MSAATESVRSKGVQRTGCPNSTGSPVEPAWPGPAPWPGSALPPAPGLSHHSRPLRPRARGGAGSRRGGGAEAVAGECVTSCSRRMTRSRSSCDWRSAGWPLAHPPRNLPPRVRVPLVTHLATLTPPPHRVEVREVVHRHHPPRSRPPTTTEFSSFGWLLVLPHTKLQSGRLGTPIIHPGLLPTPS